MSEKPSLLPKKGELWKCPPLRGRWRVRSVGRLYITLDATIPGLTPERVAIADFPAGRVPGGQWERA